MRIVGAQISSEGFEHLFVSCGVDCDGGEESVAIVKN
jgi:hypothetical protein